MSALRFLSHVSLPHDSRSFHYAPSSLPGCYGSGEWNGSATGVHRSKIDLVRSRGTSKRQLRSLQKIPTHKRYRLMILLSVTCFMFFCKLFSPFYHIKFGRFRPRSTTLFSACFHSSFFAFYCTLRVLHFCCVRFLLQSAFFWCFHALIVCSSAVDLYFF